MNVFVKETQATETIALIDPKTGVNWVTDFIGNADGLKDFEFDEAKQAYTTSQENLEWWKAVIAEHQELDNRIHELMQEHGFEAVQAAYDHVSTDLENYPAAVNQALDEAFGS